MAFDASELTRIGGGNGYGLYFYDTTDALTAVDADGYMSNTDDDLNLDRGDILIVRVWDTLRTGTPTDLGLLMVMDAASDGDVNLSNDMLSVTPSSGD